MIQITFPSSFMLRIPSTGFSLLNPRHQRRKLLIKGFRVWKSPAWAGLFHTLNGLLKFFYLLVLLGYFLAGAFFLVGALAAGFLAGAFAVRLTGPRSRLSARSSTAVSRVSCSTSVPRGTVMLVTPSVM
ncbi:hypothetical protein ABIB48_000938 [Arthrobacter sp. UYCu511]